MATFDFYVDQKCSVWERVQFEVEADTIEEAKKKAIKLFQQGEYDMGGDVETMYDTMEFMDLKDNNGNPTLELYYHDNLITDNKNDY